MNRFLSVFLLSGFLTVLIGADRIPVPQKPVNYKAHDLIDDPSGEGMLVCNQLLIAFKKDIGRQQQERLLASIGAEVIGGMPDIDVYQVLFDNPTRSIQHFREVYETIRVADDILFVMPRRVSATASGSFISDKTSADMVRRGALNLQPVSRKSGISATGTYDEIIASHRPGLMACVQKKSRLFRNLSGRVEFLLNINSSGAVTHVSITNSSFRNRKLLACLKNKIRRWRNFPKLSTDSKTELRFMFSF